MKLLPLLVLGTLALPLAHAAKDDTVARLVKQTDASRLLLIGEIHGTSETPALVAQVVDGVSKRKAQPVVLALELSADQTGHEAYVASEGTAEDKTRLLAEPFWAKAYQDGRSSQAMFELLEWVRKQARRGRPIKLASFDLDKGQFASRIDRDKLMADNLRAIVLANPSARVIALAGNYHARQSVGAQWDPQFRFMGNYLTDLGAYSVNVSAMRGSTWGCDGRGPESCKAASFARDASNGAPLGLRSDDKLKAIGYNQGLMLQTFTASLPARSPAQ